METLKVLNKKNEQTEWEVIENKKTGYYNVFSPSGRSDKSYKSIKMVVKYLESFNLHLA